MFLPKKKKLDLKKWEEKIISRDKPKFIRLKHRKYVYEGVGGNVHLRKTHFC